MSVAAAGIDTAVFTGVFDDDETMDDTADAAAAAADDDDDDAVCTPLAGLRGRTRVFSPSELDLATAGVGIYGTRTTPLDIVGLMGGLRERCAGVNLCTGGCCEPGTKFTDDTPDDD